MSASTAWSQDIEPTLQVGSIEPSAVDLLKSILNAKLNLDPPLPMDGKFDETTKGKVIEFQTGQAISSSGVVDAKTWQALFNISVNQNVKVSIQGMDALREILDAAKIGTARITSGVRTPEDQSRIMYGNIVKHGVPHQQKLYGFFGDQVIDVFVKNQTKPEDEIKALMQAKIELLGPEKVSKHCSETHDVIDVAPSSISDRAKFEQAILKAKNDQRISKYILPPGDPAYHLEIPKGYAPAEANPFQVERGQLTFDAEGTEGGQFHSRRPHVPGPTSGVTIGRGYDLKERTAEGVVKDLVAATLSKADANKYAQGVGKFGQDAKAFIANTQLVEITPDQQKLLFEIVYAEMERDVRRICQKSDVIAKYGSVDWTGLDSKIKDVLIDLRYRGDYTGSSREFLQSHVAKNDLAGFATEIRKESNWASVPEDRFNRRVAYVADASSKSLDVTSRGNDVILLQGALNGLLVPSPRLEEDGIFGPVTENAVKTYQTNVGLTANGVVGEETRQKLNRPLVKLGSSGPDVTFLQESLIRVLGPGFGVTANGIFDMATEVAAKAFQEKMRLKVDGVVGDDTWKALLGAPGFAMSQQDAIKEILEISNKYSPAPGTEEWTTLDLVKWRTPVLGDEKLIFDFKKQWCVGYVETIRAAAKKYNLPPLLVAGVAYNEVGGDPLWADDAGYEARKNEAGRWILRQMGKSEKADRTSFGNVSIQLRRAAETLGISPATITEEQERDLINLLKNNQANIFVAAKHLQVLAEIALQGTPPSETMSQEDINLVAALYTSLPGGLTIDDFRQNPVPTIKDMEPLIEVDPYIERRKETLQEILGVQGLDASVLTGEAIMFHFKGIAPDFQGADVGIVLIGERGLTKYYEFGRYEPQEGDGRVRNVIIPNVSVVGPEASQSSLTHLCAFLAKAKQAEAGLANPPKMQGAYFRFMSFSHMRAFASEAIAKSDENSPKFDPNRKKFSALKYNSAHFAEEVAFAGNPKVDRPLFSQTTPAGIIQAYIAEGNAEVSYDPHAQPPLFPIGPGNEASAKLP
ncbi:peptidoglycan-binding protein [Blastopirellula sp. J2-11]|uniref:peptidoglycan-binding protein n=1 Tax=Blastopirellula sp. J2-11 TaxID=2943192 RepID=UPI0021C8828A|nr:peptidoglycan-binding protein [Blastopirellula sp. J2-11]UUO04948.1 peptidoglycan-binding protein [Blastopirellula sp. J2-11]